MRLDGFIIETHEKYISCGYFADDKFEIYFKDFTLIKHNCSLSDVEKICIKYNIENIWNISNETRD